MLDLLSIIAIVVLLALVVLSLNKQRGGRTLEKADEEARTEGADAQRERSMRRRDEARTAGHVDH
jgi:hypothetical protein